MIERSVQWHNFNKFGILWIFKIISKMLMTRKMNSEFLKVLYTGFWNRCYGTGGLHCGCCRSCRKPAPYVLVMTIRDRRDRWRGLGSVDVDCTGLRQTSLCTVYRPYWFSCFWFGRSRSMAIGPLRRKSQLP